MDKCSNCYIIDRAKTSYCPDCKKGKVNDNIARLKPCPFCGNDDPTIRIFKGKDGWRDRYAVLCNYDEGGCGAESGVYHSEAEAIESWNRRVGEKRSESTKI